MFGVAAFVAHVVCLTRWILIGGMGSLSSGGLPGSASAILLGRLSQQLPFLLAIKWTCILSVVDRKASFLHGRRWLPSLSFQTHAGSVCAGLMVVISLTIDLNSLIAP